LPLFVPIDWWVRLPIDTVVLVAPTDHLFYFPFSIGNSRRPRPARVGDSFLRTRSDPSSTTGTADSDEFIRRGDSGHVLLTMTAPHSDQIRARGWFMG
jgi:hypothetical protein